MRDVLKQRLIGALILVALGVIFWPIIFVDQHEHEVERTAIPPRPAVVTTPLVRPSAQELRGSPELRASEGESVADPGTGSAQLGQNDGDSVVNSAAENAGENARDPGDSLKGSVAKSGRSTSSPEVVAPTATPSPGLEVPRTRREAPASPALDADGVPIAWILQVVSVSSEAKAEELRGQLLAIDEKAYVKRVRKGGKSLYRVYIGPKFERARLENLKPRIDSEFKVDSLVMRYLP